MNSQRQVFQEKTMRHTKKQGKKKSHCRDKAINKNGLKDDTVATIREFLITMINVLKERKNGQCVIRWIISTER